jgi:RHS repeat-associated protein
VTESFSPSGTNSGYNGYGELKAQVVTTGATSLYQLGGVTRDALGRFTARTETIAVPPGSGLPATITWAYSYDTAGRLWTATRNGVLATFTYGANGNRDGCTYDEQDRIRACGSTTYSFSNAGSLLSKGTTSFTYDLEGALWAATPPSGGISYFVDAGGRRIKRTQNSAVTQWVYDERGRLLGELDGAGAITQVFANGARSDTPELLLQVNPSPPHFRNISEHLGSVRLVLDLSTPTTATIKQRIDYDAWGNATADWVDTSDTNFKQIPFGFAGGLWDRSTNLVRFGARDYDPTTGRWTSKDPIRFDGGLNLYAYVGDDPINRIDPDGMGWLCDTFGIFCDGPIGPGPGHWVDPSDPAGSAGPGSGSGGGGAGGGGGGGGTGGAAGGEGGGGGTGDAPICWDINPKPAGKKCELIGAKDAGAFAKCTYTCPSFSGPQQHTRMILGGKSSDCYNPANFPF